MTPSDAKRLEARERTEWRKTVAIIVLGVALFFLFFEWGRTRASAKQLARDLHRVCEAAEQLIPALRRVEPNPWNPSAHEHPYFRARSQLLAACEAHPEEFFEIQELRRQRAAAKP